ncbi:MAG TPA: hypothetical protein VFX88_17465, partial [Actinomycetota bacterium]|nr:hypothetical protein [Actinomycetota bacterium]
PVHRGQELVAVAEVVLPELPGGVAERLQQLGDGRVLGLEADRSGTSIRAPRGAVVTPIG